MVHDCRSADKHKVAAELQTCCRALRSNDLSDDANLDALSVDLHKVAQQRHPGAVRVLGELEHVPKREVQKVNQTLVAKHLAGGYHVCRGQVESLHRQAHSQHKGGPAPLSNAAHNLQKAASPVFERASVLVVASVVARQKRGQNVSVGTVHFHPVKSEGEKRNENQNIKRKLGSLSPGFLCSLCSAHKPLHHVADFGRRQRASSLLVGRGNAGNAVNRVLRFGASVMQLHDGDRVVSANL